MKRMMVFLLLSASGPGLQAQTTVPPGTVLPVRLDSSVSSAKSTPEQTVRARVMQNILLPGGSEIRQGSEVIGHLVRLSPAPVKSPAEMILTFDSIKLANHTVPLRTSLRALASNLDVADAGTANYFDDATPSTHGTTTQVGGEVV